MERKKKLLIILALCAALLLSACGASTAETPQKGSVVPEEAAEEVTESPSGEAESPSDEPTEEELEAQNGGAFERLAGTWVADEGFSILTVYENGGFLLDGDESAEGYLVYTDEDGEGLWDSGPRYELYLENNERVPNCYFAFDDANPGKLVYAVGGGAELFSRPDTVYDENGAVLRVLRPDATFFAVFDDTETFVHDDGDYSTEIAFCPTRDLQDFKFLSIAWQDSDDGGVFYSVEELYSTDTLTPERPLLVQISFPGDMPSTGISYTDADGATQYYAVSESGYDGSLVLSGFTRVEG